MEACYEILLTIYEIVKSDPSPETYLVTPHDIILRQSMDWEMIEKQLDVLAKEQLITTKQLGKLTISITTAGVVKANKLKNNFVSRNFSLSDEKVIIAPVK